MSKVICALNGNAVRRIDAKLFFSIEKHIIDSGLGEDKDSFAVIKERLLRPPVLSAEEFAEECFYVILAGGFRQKVAKRKLGEIMEFIRSGRGSVCERNLLPIFNNANKMRAVAKIWGERQRLRDEFYALAGDAERLEFLGGLPHIGEVTKNHLARNLGISNVKYDVWIQRLGIALSGLDLEPGFPLRDEAKAVCDKMFAGIERATGLNKGYIDVVLWKACQEGILKF